MTEVKGYTYHRVFDGYNFLSASGAMEEIVGTDMELVSKADHDDALRRAKAEGMREIRQLRRHLRVALDHAEQHREGCLYCGEGEIVDGATTPAHRAKCWYYKAARAAQIEADYE